MEELPKRYRPRALKDVVGQPNAVKVLTKMLDEQRVAHSLLLTGPSGTGKTTIARILARKLGCDRLDFKEINTADFRGIELVRKIRDNVTMSAVGDARVWLIDECHQLSSEAQNAFLKIIEDTPGHVYFMFATTDANKLIKTLRNRCTVIPLSSIANDVLTKLIKRVAAEEKIKVAEAVIDRIVAYSEGSARAALVHLNKIMGIDDEDDQLAAIVPPLVEEQAINLCRALIYRKSWKDVSKLIKDINEDAEQLRWLVLSYASTVLLGTNTKEHHRANLILSAFRDNFYDSKRAGLINAAFEVCGSK